MTTVMSSSNTLIVGSISLDTIETVSDRKESLLGGSATYATIAAARYLLFTSPTVLSKKKLKIC